VTGRKGSRRQIIVLGVIVLAGVGLGVVAVREAWPGLMQRRYLGQLHEDPALLFEFLGSDDESRRSAAEKFLTKRPAKQEVFRRYLDEFDSSKATWHIRRGLERHRKSGTIAGHLGLTPTGVFTHYRRATGGSSTGSMASPPTDPPRRELLLDLIGGCTNEVFEHPELPGFQFRVVRVEDGRASEPPWPPATSAPVRSRPRKITGKANHVLFFRVTH